MGRYQGALSTVPAPRLGAVVVRAAVERAGLPDLSAIDEVLMGNVVSAGLGQAPARQAAIFAGLPPTVGATTINKVCGSEPQGLHARRPGDQGRRRSPGGRRRNGKHERRAAPCFARSGLRYGHQQVMDAVLLDGLWDPFENWAMGMAAEYIAEAYEVTREAMDLWSLQSHQKALAAIQAGKFKAEIVPVEVPGQKCQTARIVADETPRADTSLEKLAALKPAFKPDGRVTAGNAPGLNDGAAAVVIASREKAAALGAQPLARIVGYAQAAVPPKELFIAPARHPLALQRVGWTSIGRPDRTE
jgi:acetyl-CoA C-acetyltransferase